MYAMLFRLPTLRIFLGFLSITASAVLAGRCGCGNLEPGIQYYARVTAYNAVGYGPVSATSMATPRGQATAPVVANVSLPVLDSGSALTVTWAPAGDDGGDPVTGYELEWYSDPGAQEIQKLTTSSTDGITAVQSIRTSADSDSITGSFTLSFGGETTQPILHNSPADGEQSVESKLKRLSTIGNVSVKRDLSWAPVQNELFSIASATTTLTGMGSTDMTTLFSVADVVSIGGETHTVAAVSISTVTLEDAYGGPAASGSYVYKWAHGYEWTVTFSSHVGEQPLLEANPAENWAGINPSINVRHVRHGLQPLSGTFQLQFGGEKSEPLQHGASAADVKVVLESLKTIGEVDVSRFRNNNGYNFFVTFVTEMGNVELLSVDDAQLTGPNARARVATIQDGTLPSEYGRKSILSPSTLTDTIRGLQNGASYFVRVRARNELGLGSYTLASPAPFAPMEPPSAPTAVSMHVLSNREIRIVWKAPESTGGGQIAKYLLQWDVDGAFPNVQSPGFHELVTPASTEIDGVFCYTIRIDESSSSSPRFGRVLAHNGYEWSPPGIPDPAFVTAHLRPPGSVRELTAYPTSSVGIMLEWAYPLADTCAFGGDGGSPVTHVVVEWDVNSDFSSPAESVSVPSSASSYHLGGRDTVTGAESSVLEAGGSYYLRVTAFNALGSSLSSVIRSESGVAKTIGPLSDTVPDSPLIHPPDITNVLSATSLRVDWDSPSLDGGSVIQSYSIDYDVTEHFDNPTTVTLPVVHEMQTAVVHSPGVSPEVQALRATVEVVNEVQSVRTTVTGVDEVQTVTTTCDDVTAEVQTVTTTAVDTDEEQRITLVASDLDEIQLVRLHGDDVPEIQGVTVSVPRVNEIQQFGILISNINTDGDNADSFACFGVNTGETCQDIEDAISGSFTVSFEFDQCGGGGGNANFCQAALSEYDPALGMISCTPAMVADPGAGGSHCVSSPVTLSYGATEGDIGTLESALNGMLDDNGVSFMTSANMPSKQTGVTVTRTAGITTKGGCTLDPLGGPAVCTGSYEISYAVEFDAVHTTGDAPPLSIVTSNVRLDTTSTSFSTKMCPPAYFVNGCDVPIGSALDASHGSFYENAASHTAVETTKGDQPSGMIELEYECESSVDVLPVGKKMTTSADGLTAAFDDGTYADSMAVGQYMRFSAGDGIDIYRRIVSVDTVSDVITFDSPAPSTSTDYTDVETGNYFSDWNEVHGSNGVSDHCLASRKHTTLPIDISRDLASVSVPDFLSKLGALSVLDSTGITITRDLTADLLTDVGFEWRITFLKQPGAVNEMSCTTVSGTNSCAVSTLQESSILGGAFQLGTTWPHEFVAESPAPFSSGSIRWNSNADDTKAHLESVLDGIDRVFGSVTIVRTPFVVSAHDRWSGGYSWQITFTSRGGNIPAMSVDKSNIIGNAVMEVADEDSGFYDTYQGSADSSTFSIDVDGSARDGNQISGSFAISWSGNAVHASVSTGDVFSVRTGGGGADEHTALSAASMEAILTEHVFLNVPGQVLVTRSSTPTQWMGYTYFLVFKHEAMGGDIPPLVPVVGGNLHGTSASAQVDEAVKGTSMRGTFQLRFAGETTRPINHDASAEDMQDALNQLSSIAPSAVVVTRTAEPVKTGPASGNGGMSTQVGGYSWSITFASNTWRDPTVEHDLSYIPGNWFGPAASRTENWENGFSKAWGKNVGDVPLIECIDGGLWTTNGALPTNGCQVSELVAGTDPLGGAFKLCLDSSFSPNNVMSVETDACTSLIDHNALASAEDTGGDGSSVEEKLEELLNVGDVTVVRGPVDLKTGGHTWTIQFVRDADGPCQQKDDVEQLCNAPGDVPTICHSGGSTPCDTSALKGSCLRPGSCSKLTVLDAIDFVAGNRPPGSIDVQTVAVKDPDYVGWSDGSVVDVAVTKEFKLNVDGVETGCIAHNAAGEGMRSSIQAALDGGNGGTVHVRMARPEAEAPNGFLFFATFYDTGDLPTMTSLYGPATCSSPFSGSQEVVVTGTSDGALHGTTCASCADGVVHRGSFSLFEVAGEGLSGTLNWNALPSAVKSHLEAIDSRSVDVTRTVLDKYGSIEWMVTFTENAGMTPPGTGDVDMLNVDQGVDTSGFDNPVFVNEVRKGSTGLSGTFNIDFFSSSGPRQVAFDETPERLMMKLREMSTMGHVFATRDCYPSCDRGGWGAVAVPEFSGVMGGYEFRIHFVGNPGTSNGVSFPNGSGNIPPPSIDSALLLGTGADAESTALTEGSTPLTGTFTLSISGEETQPIPYNADTTTVEQSLGDLSNTGRISARSGIHCQKLIEGITVSASKDGHTLQVSGDDLKKHLAPGDRFRVGGSHNSNVQGELEGADGAVYHGAATLAKGSPLLSDTAPSMPLISVGEEVRLGGFLMVIKRNGLEVQQLSVHRASGISDAPFYQLKLSNGGSSEATACLAFDATAPEVQSALNSLSGIGADGALVTKSQGTSGIHGDAHVYNIYFRHSVTNMNELVVEDCVLGLPGGVDASNSHASARTFIEGGSVDHQRVVLSADSGTTGSVEAFRLTISDPITSASVSTPCVEWGARTLDLNSVLSGAFADDALSVGPAAVTQFADDLYDVEASGFVEGSIVIGDTVNPGGSCLGIVESVGSDGKTVRVEAPGGCSAVAGDPFSVLQDTSVTESTSGRQAAISQVATVSFYSDAPVADSLGLYKLSLTFRGVTQTTSCLRYGASSSTVQAAIDGIFDYNLDGTVDAADWGHVTVEKDGDGSSASAYGYVYSFESKGSVSLIGVSAVLGSGAPSIAMAGIGDEIGCSDAAGSEIVLTNTASTTDTNTQITTVASLAGHVRSGSRVKIDASASPTKVWFVDQVSQDGRTITLSEAFAGTTTLGTTTISLIAGGVPRVSTEVVRTGQDEYVYDIFFTGSYWSDVPGITVNVFGDGSCTADESHVFFGMNRNVAVISVSDGGATLPVPNYALDRAIDASLEGPAELFLLPPIYTVHDDTFEVQRILVKDTDNAAIWGGGGSSFKLGYNGEFTGCLLHSSSDAEIEAALNALNSITQVTVTRSTDAVLAPNGFVFTVYFHENMDVEELIADTTNGDCVPFTAVDGEVVSISTIKNGRPSFPFSTNEVPLGTAEDSSVPGTWLGDDASSLSLYRVTGTYWAIEYVDHLGDMGPMTVSHDTLSASASAEVHDNLVRGSNPTSAVISDLTTGVEYFTRVSATTEVGSSAESTCSCTT